MTRDEILLSSRGCTDNPDDSSTMSYDLPRLSGDKESCNGGGKIFERKVSDHSLIYNVTKVIINNLRSEFEKRRVSVVGMNVSCRGEEGANSNTI